MIHEKITHIDLFSGIGGFALAADRVFPGIEHVFCDNDSFCAEVLKKHWPESKIYGDIRTITADAERERPHTTKDQQKLEGKGSSQFRIKQPRIDGRPFLLTGGFPCQPFSQAGRRRGEEDDRFLWPEMLRVIREFSPLWVIAENVRGLLTQGGGVVFERVCTDLESAGYEVQPIIIPAVAVGAPHRRDRVWFVAHRKSTKQKRSGRARTRRKGFANSSLDDAESEQTHSAKPSRFHTKSTGTDWNENWLEVATRLCGVDDEFSYWVDGRGKKRNSRNARLKALGNAIVPAVAEQIMLAIKDTCGTMDTI
mgnify:CR=1 FL=1